MSFRGLLNTTCTIQRVVTVNTGPEAGETWSDNSTSVPCRLSMLRAHEIGELHSTLSVTHRLYLPYGTSITNDDRVVIDSVTYDVEMVNADPGSRQHHVEALVRAAT